MTTTQDDEHSIFHRYSGLFVYNLKTKCITHSLDLESIGCHVMQGSAYCEVSVNQDGSSIQLHPMDNDKMYIYDVEKNKLTQTNYEPMEDPFKVIINDNPNGSVSYKTVKFENGDIGYWVRNIQGIKNVSSTQIYREVS